MRYVVDASVAIKWAIPELDSDRAVALREATNNGQQTLSAPAILQVEVAHALTRLERRNVLLPGTTLHFLGQILQTPFDFVPFLPLLARAVAISSEERIGVYDCLYVALAELEGCELVTADVRLVDNLQLRYPFVIALASVP